MKDFPAGTILQCKGCHKPVFALTQDCNRADHFSYKLLKGVNGVPDPTGMTPIACPFCKREAWYTFIAPESSGYKIIHLKCHPDYYHDVDSGAKGFEVRLNDRDFKVGDRLILHEYTPENGYTGAICYRRITYILDHPDYVKEGYVILSLGMWEVGS